MKTFLEYCSAYFKRMSLIDHMLLKVSIFSLALLIGMILSPKQRDAKITVLTAIVSASSLLLIKGFLQFFRAHRLDAME
ncbi:MAG: hypothetical protein LLG09_06445 [Negativicutes bacterium]|nr:hypothetical protein [Negativicutes bacterium]